MNYLPAIYLVIVLFFLAQAFHHFYTSRPKQGAALGLIALGVWIGLLA